MCNVTDKLIVAALIAASLCSCGKDEDKEKADALVVEIEALVQQEKPIEALALMDTINQKYPLQIEARKRVSALQPKAIEMVTIKRIETADSLIAEAQLGLQELESQFKHIASTAGLEGYYVVADAYDANFINKTAMEARINDADFNFYIVAQNNSGKIDLNQVALSTAESQCQSEAIPASSARRMQVEGSEMASFLPEEVNALGAWANDNAEQIKSGMLIGTKGQKKVSLTPAQARSFGKTWQYADYKQKLRSALITREKLERQLQVARDQQANHLE